MIILFTDMVEMWMQKLSVLHKGHHTMILHYILLQGTAMEYVSKDLYRLMPICGQKIVLDSQQRDLWLTQD